MAVCLGSWTLRKERLAQRKGKITRSGATEPSSLTLRWVPTICWGSPKVPSECDHSSAGWPGWVLGGREPSDGCSVTAVCFHHQGVAVSFGYCLQTGSCGQGKVQFPAVIPQPDQGRGPNTCSEEGPGLGSQSGCSEGRGKQPAQVGLGLRPRWGPPSISVGVQWWLLKGGGCR